MTSITVDRVTLDYPIYGASSQSFRRALFAHTGGLIRREGHRQQRVVVRALEDISFSLDHGDRLGIVGHNGAGKSTLLRLLAGVYEPISGKVIVEGRISPLFVAAPGLDYDDTGLENIYTCGTYLGMSKREIEEKFPDIADFCELGDYLSLPVRTYSAGMVTRLGFAIATALHPDVLLLDEGLAAGDARFAVRAEKRMRELVARSSILIIASHSDAIIQDICNKAMLLEQGRLIEIGDVKEVLETYHRRAGDANVD